MPKSFKPSKKELYHYTSSTGQIPYFLARSPRRKTITISIDPQAQVNVAAPYYLVHKEIERFIREKENWVIKNIHQINQRNEFIKKKRFEHGEEFLFLGEKYKLEVQETHLRKSQIVFDGSRWIMALPAGQSLKEYQYEIKERLIQWYRDQAKEILGGRIFHFSRILGIEPQKIVVKTQKRIWGSCDYRKKAIHLNWKIILSPLKVVDYVVVHELCHLLVPNHSKRFWQKVERVMPDYSRQRQWLRANAQEMVLP